MALFLKFHSVISPRTVGRAPMLRRQKAPSRHAGFSIIELLVALAVGMALTVAITLIMMRHDGTRRSLTSSNDAQLNANFLSHELDRALRSAGTGFAQGWRSTYGCLLHVTRSGTQLLPPTSSLPAPFASVAAPVRLAPVLIYAAAGNGGTDVLAVASGASGTGETASRVLPGSVTHSSLSIPTTVGMRGEDLVLVAEAGVGCMLQQVSAPFTGGAAQMLNFSGAYSAASIASLSLAGFSGSATVSLLGNRTGNPPQMRLIGLGDNNTLFNYDLLRLDGSDTARPMADGVVSLRALYGVDSNGDGQLDSWVAPTAAGFTAAALQDGSDTARARLLSIMAIRLAMVLRSDRVERENVSAPSMTLFADLPTALHITQTLNADQQRMRHRLVEITVPLRNTIHQSR